MKAYNIILTVSILLMAGGFMLPPAGVIDGSVITSVGLLLMFAVVAQIPDILATARNGRSIRLQKGDFKAEVGSAECERN